MIHIEYLHQKSFIFDCNYFLSPIQTVFGRAWRLKDKNDLLYGKSIHAIEYWVKKRKNTFIKVKNVRDFKFCLCHSDQTRVTIRFKSVYCTGTDTTLNSKNRPGKYEGLCLTLIIPTFWSFLVKELSSESELILAFHLDLCSSHMNSTTSKYSFKKIFLA